MEAEENLHFDQEPDAESADQPEDLAEPAHEDAGFEESHAQLGGRPGIRRRSPPRLRYDDSSAKKWYIIHTYSGFENKVAESLRTRVGSIRISPTRSGRS